MMGPGEVFIALIVIGLPVMLLMIIANRFFRLREKKLEVEASLAAEKAAQYASRSMELEQRVRVLEQIVTDAGAQTAGQIVALREFQRLPSGEETK
jgi:ABC-type phosphate transport system auxiliary subunit